MHCAAYPAIGVPQRRRFAALRARARATGYEPRDEASLRAVSLRERRAGSSACLERRIAFLPGAFRPLSQLVNRSSQGVVALSQFGVRVIATLSSLSQQPPSLSQQRRIWGTRAG
jgi:hypothetical protein